MKNKAIILILLILLFVTTTACHVPSKPDENFLALQAQVADDETYTNYQKFDRNDGMYSDTPDRIYFKDPDEKGFYVFEKNREDFAHIMEVVEDRIHYAMRALENERNECFTPDSLENIQTSGKTYVILHYDNTETDERSKNYRSNIIFSFSREKRLYRLLKYLSYNEEPVTVTEEFTQFTDLTGAQYMQLKSKYPYDKDGLTWLSYYVAYRENDMAYSLSQDGGKTFTDYIPRKKAIEIANQEAQKTCYQFQNRESIFSLSTADINSVEMARNTAEEGTPPYFYKADGAGYRVYWEKEWETEHYQNSGLLWAVRLFDEKDPLNSLYIYIDAVNGSVVGAGRLTD